jgi:hypothetical protein
VPPVAPRSAPLPPSGEALGDNDAAAGSVLGRSLSFGEEAVMAFDLVDPRAEHYMRGPAARHDEPVLVEMERLAEERDFPIVGRLVGELLASVVELGSGFGYSAYWFSRAVGPGGTVVCIDGEPATRDL